MLCAIWHCSTASGILDFRWIGLNALTSFAKPLVLAFSMLSINSEPYDTGEMGLEQNKEEALKYWEKAADGGDIGARHNLGCLEEENGDRVAAMRHVRLSASGGYKEIHGRCNRML